MPDPKDPNLPLYFQFFNEVAIIQQLATAMFEAEMPKGLLVSHFSVLNHLVRVKDGRTPLELARAFQVPKTTFTHTLKGLLEHGLVDVRPNPEDARSKQVWITQDGLAFREDALMAVMPRLNELSDHITLDQITALLPDLEHIRKILDSARD